LFYTCALSDVRLKIGRHAEQREFAMKSAATLLLLVFVVPALAALPVGAQAPNFVAPGVQGTTTTTVDLSELLKKGPVVLFFFPSVFAGGSSEESHEFADNIDKFRAAGATVVGMSRDPVDALARFSTEECAGKFPLASADLNIVTGFDVNDNANFTTRTTYVIGLTGNIAFVHDDDGYSGHVKNALAFIQRMNPK
jgi:thioredoxin-dependent peroxiredoxin